MCASRQDIVLNGGSGQGVALHLARLDDEPAVNVGHVAKQVEVHGLFNFVRVGKYGVGEVDGSAEGFLVFIVEVYSVVILVIIVYDVVSSSDVHPYSFSLSGRGKTYWLVPISSTALFMKDVILLRFRNQKYWPSA